MTNKLFVGSLSWNATEQMLQDLFSQVGTVQSVAIIMDKYSGKSKGFAFVEMTTKEEADAAIEALNGKDFEGRGLVVNEARPMTDRPPRREGGNGGGGDRGGDRGGFSSFRKRTW